MGKDVSTIFKMFDQDGDGSLDPQEILQGFKNVLGVYLSREDNTLLTMHLD